MKRIGVLTSGGDTPGMNAAIRSVFKTGVDMDMQVMGIYHGYKGLIEGRVDYLGHADVESKMHKGGTILRTARSEEFKTKEGQKRALNVLRAYGIEGLIVIGGDGSFRGADVLSGYGIPVVGIPGTIDNDMGYTDFTIGFDTAVNNVMNEIYKIRDTMRAHDRVGVIEVMGHRCGDIALWAGISGAADLILVPERPMPWAEAADMLAANKLRGQLTSIVMIAEGAGKAEDFCKFVRENTDVEIKATVLGYIQRGGNPSAFDRVLAAKFGQRAVELLADNNGGRAVGISKNSIIDVSLTEAVETKDRFDDKLYDLNTIMAKF
ncbi:MAG: 6-phosphofructokinase [Christensenellaceae bacterium]|nr:6-phosphofructokinase [Christensenellaceae bacterium]